jgi:8-oxo-dGTP diphosphatase
MSQPGVHPTPPHDGRVRAASRGLVVRGDELLVSVMVGERHREFWLTPGGGQHFGETKVDNVAREVLEETGYRVSVGDLACGRDYIGATHFPEWDSGFHQSELFFWCTLVDPDPLPPSEVDERQVGVRWASISDLVGGPFFPQALARWLNQDPSTRPLWLGDVN